MISKQQVKFVKSLKLKKYRNKAALFLVEGAKNVNELLSSDYGIQRLFVSEKYLIEFPHRMISKHDYVVCKEKNLVDLGTFQTNEYALAIAEMRSFRMDISNDKLVLALDDVSDPGNLGTIIRIADWYGIKNIIASLGSADFYNPKVINASMGSFTRVNINYLDLQEFFKLNKTHRVYGAVLNGENVHRMNFDKPSILLMGNESNGINSSLIKSLDSKITIPGYGGAESLNVAVSTAIICDNFFRQMPS
jgi:TrmH family RNA methyltransferase